jgi:ankyrin repeat protein
LDLVQIEDRYNSIQSAHPGTCEWLLTNQKYQSWLDDSLLPEHHGLLWLKGKPGAGKSTIMKFAVSEGKRMREEDIHIHFFFNARGSSLEKSTEGMYRSLLFRFFKGLPEAEEVFGGFDVFQLPKKPKYSWTLQQLQEVLRRVIKGLGDHRLWIYVDALDEGNEDEIRRMISFFELLGNDVVHYDIKMRVFFASRYYPNITMTKKVELKLEDEIEHASDIKSYIESELKTGNDTENPKVLKIREEISRRASGVFIWVVMVIQILNKAYDHGQIYGLEDELKKIPQDLGLLFKEILTRDNNNMQATRVCIQWVLFAKRPLTREELYFAIYSGTYPERVGKLSAEITIENMDAFILSSSKGLVQLPEWRTGTVQFIHETIRDFFLKENGIQYIQEMSAQSLLGSGHDSLKQYCVNYILSSDTQFLPGSFAEIGLEDIDALPFIGYAHSYVFFHANVAEANGASQESFLQKFDFRTWIRLDEAVSRIWSYDYYSPDSSLLYILAEQNLKWLIETMLRIYPQIDIEGERLSSPIRIALSRRHYEAVEAFLTPSHAESLAGDHHPTAFAQPPDRNVISDLTDTYFYTRPKSEISDSSVLQFFLQWGVESHALTLLRSGRFKLDFNSPKTKRTPLWIAAQRGFGKLVEFFLNEKDVNPDHTDISGLTPLAISAIDGRLDIVRLLLNCTGVNVNSTCNDARTPISYAAEKGHQNVVELLLCQDKIEPNQKDKDGRTPFFYAATKGHEGIIKLLVATPGIDIISQANSGHTSLSYAVMNGHEDVVRQLLATKRFDLNSRDTKHGRTPLSFAFQYHRWAIAKLLLAEPSIDVNAPLKTPTGSYSTENEDDRTPLSCAAANGHFEMINLLLSMDDIDPDIKEAKDGRTPLSLAATKGHAVVVKCLLATRKVAPNSKDTKYRTPLWWAAEQGHDAVVELLLAEDDVDPNIQDTEYGQTPLSVAAENGHEAAASLLLAKQLVNRHLVDIYGRDPQMLATVKGHYSIAQLLDR